MVPSGSAVKPWFRTPQGYMEVRARAGDWGGQAGQCPGAREPEGALLARAPSGPKLTWEGREMTRYLNSSEKEQVHTCLE